MFPGLTANGIPKGTPHGRLLCPSSMSGRNKANWVASSLRPLHTYKINGAMLSTYFIL